MTWQEHATPGSCPTWQKIGRPRTWQPLLEPLRGSPGVWELVRTYDHPQAAWQAVTDLRAAGRGKGRAAPLEGRWEFRSAQVTPNVPGWGVWARYLGTSTGETLGCAPSGSQAARAEVTA